MKSPNLPELPAAAGVYRLRTAGVADPCAREAGVGPADLLAGLGEAGEGPGSGSGRRTIEVLAVGRPGEVDGHPAALGAVGVDLTDSVLLPGMVNAHTHLDLTHLGPQAHDPGEGFVAWVDRIRAGRASEAGAIRASVARGIELSLRAGVVLVGDIAGAPGGQPRLEPFEELADSPVAGVSFVEFFAIGPREAASLARVEAALEGATVARGEACLGLQPHAPNTVSLPAYRRATELARRHGLPLSTHLAETPEEREFIARGTGPQREMLERLGSWSEAILEHVGRGRSPLDHLAGVLGEAAFLLAHVNDLGSEPNRAIGTLARARADVVYCPRASAYFDAPAHLGPHRYRDMLAAGVNVCLGTDSIVNLPAGVDGPDGPGLGVLDEARLLFARDRTDPATLLRMMTVNGCLALGWEESACSLAPGARPLGLVAVDVDETPGERAPMERAIVSRSPARLLTCGTGLRAISSRAPRAR